MKPLIRRESDILSSCLKLLKARGALVFRRGVGGMKNPKGQYVRFGLKGEADIEAHFKAGPRHIVLRGEPDFWWQHVVWVECKREGGKQSPAQREFQLAIEAHGETYLICHSAAMGICAPIIGMNKPVSRSPRLAERLYEIV